MLLLLGLVAILAMVISPDIEVRVFLGVVLALVLLGGVNESE